MTAPKSKTTADRLCEYVKAAQEAGQTVAKARVEGRSLPKYVHRRKRDGVLLFRKRQGARIVEVRLETQFPEEGPALPYTLASECANILRQLARGRENPQPGPINFADLVDPYDEPSRPEYERFTVDSGRVPKAVMFAVFRRDGHFCAYCGVKEARMHLDHIIPWSRGGETTVENLTVCCETCNMSKGNRTPEEWRGRRK